MALNNRNGSAGGVKDGYAVRRVDGWSNSDTPAIGWLKGALPKSDPQGSAEVKIGPNTKVWSAERTSPFMTGDQGKGKR